MFYSELSDSVKHFKEIAVDYNVTAFSGGFYPRYASESPRIEPTSHLLRKWG
jgi:hypothetical protein